MTTYRFKDEHAIRLVFTLQTGTRRSSGAHSNTMDIRWSREKEVSLDHNSTNRQWLPCSLTVVPSSKHLCHHGCELQRMGPGKNPNRQLDNLRPAALHACSSGPSSLGANYITKTVFNQVLPVPSPTSTPRQLPSILLHFCPLSPLLILSQIHTICETSKKRTRDKKQGGCSSSCSTTTLSSGRAHHD